MKQPVTAPSLLTPNPGRLIAFEGVDGSGKTTIMRMVADELRRQGHDVVETREPGGTSSAEQIRALLVQGATDRWTPMGELLLHAAARAEHVARVIRPALAAGRWVLCDRFVGSSIAYQGYGHGLGMETVMSAHQLASGGLMPDLSIVLDVATEVAAGRLGERTGIEDRYERTGAEFMARVRRGYAAMIADPVMRAIAIDNSGAPEDAAAAAMGHVGLLLAVN